MRAKRYRVELPRSLGFFQAVVESPQEIWRVRSKAGVTDGLAVIPARFSRPGYFLAFVSIT